MTRLLLPKGRKGFSVCEMLIAIAVIMILMGMMAQGFIWVKYHAEVTSLTGRANHFATALQLYYQNNGKFPSAYPAQLDKDLAPYIEDSEFCSLAPSSAAMRLAGRTSYSARALRMARTRFTIRLICASASASATPAASGQRATISASGWYPSPAPCSLLLVPCSLLPAPFTRFCQISSVTKGMKGCSRRSVRSST